MSRSKVTLTYADGARPPQTVQWVNCSVGEVKRTLVTYAGERLGDMGSIDASKSTRNFNVDGVLVDHLLVGGERLVPASLLPDDAGVVFESSYSHEYRVASAEHVAAKAKHDANMAQCQKLLHDLPIALANSQAALRAESAAVGATPRPTDAQVLGLGYMSLEQRRIEQEIDEQKTRLPKLEAAVPKLDEAKFLTHTRSLRLELGFGSHLLDGCVYHLQRWPPACEAQPAEPILISSAKP